MKIIILILALLLIWGRQVNVLAGEISDSGSHFQCGDY